MPRSRIPKATQAHAAAHAAQVDDDVIVEPEAPYVPADWVIGALLNVRNGGDAYIVTLYPEEYDWRHPERALRFHNSARCQDFVSAWYARTYQDPRA